jgi:hypothetical protein
MSEKSSLEFDKLNFEEISLEGFSEKFRQMLIVMRSHINTCDIEDEFKFVTGCDLSLIGYDESSVFEIADQYEGFLQSRFIDEYYDIVLPDGVVNIYSQIEVINNVQIPWFSVGIFNEELSKTRKKMLVCKTPTDDSMCYWSLSKNENSSPENIPAKFRLIADKLRQSQKIN